MEWVYAMDVSRFLWIALRWSWLIVLAGLVAGGAAFFVSELLPRQYESEARVLVGSRTEPNFDKLRAYGQLAQMYSELVTTAPVLTRVADRLGLAEDPEELNTRIYAHAPSGGTIIRLVVTAGSPSEAAALANALADEVAGFGTGVPGQPSIAEIVQPATPPERPSAPRPFLNAAVSAALGLSIGLGLSLRLAARKTTSSEEDDFQRP